MVNERDSWEIKREEGKQQPFGSSYLLLLICWLILLVITAEHAILSPLAFSFSFSDSWATCVCLIILGRARLLQNTCATNSIANKNWHGFQSFLVKFWLMFLKSSLLSPHFTLIFSFWMLALKTLSFSIRCGGKKNEPCRCFLTSYLRPNPKYIYNPKYVYIYIYILVFMLLCLNPE